MLTVTAYFIGKIKSTWHLHALPKIQHPGQLHPAAAAAAASTPYPPLVLEMPFPFFCVLEQRQPICKYDDEMLPGPGCWFPNWNWSEEDQGLGMGVTGVGVADSSSALNASQTQVKKGLPRGRTQRRGAAIGSKQSRIQTNIVPKVPKKIYNNQGNIFLK